MVEEWQLVRLGEVATTSQGGTPRKNEADYWNGQIPFLTGADLTGISIEPQARPFISYRRRTPFWPNRSLRTGSIVTCY